MARPAGPLSVLLARRWRWVFAGLLLVISGCASGVGDPTACFGSVLCDYDLRTPAGRWLLPDALDEASGLAALGEGVWLSHNDNGSTFWRLDARDGFDARPVSVPGDRIGGDFEGVAIAGRRLFALTSRGGIYRARLSPEGVPGPLVPMAAPLIGCGNFEGIAAAADGTIHLACKYPIAPRPGSIRLYRLAYDGPDDPAPAVAVVEVDVAHVLTATGLTRLRPSGLTWADDGLRRLLLLAGKERVLLDVDAHAGTVRAWRRLDRRRHRQAEGISRGTQGELAIVDEADGRTGTLTVYRPSNRRPYRRPDL